MATSSSQKSIGSALSNAANYFLNQGAIGRTTLSGGGARAEVSVGVPSTGSLPTSGLGLRPSGSGQAANPYEEALAKANAANEARFKEALGLIDQKLSGISGFGQTDLELLSRERDKSQADLTQDLISRGLFNTSLVEGNRRAIDDRFDFQRRALGERLALLKGDVLSEKAGLLERKQDVGPDPALFAQLFSNAAAAPQTGLGSILGQSGLNTGQTGQGQSNTGFATLRSPTGSPNAEQAQLLRQRSNLQQRLQAAQSKLQGMPTFDINPTTGRPNTARRQTMADIEAIASQIAQLDQQLGAAGAVANRPLGQLLGQFNTPAIFSAPQNAAPQNAAPSTRPGSPTPSARPGTNLSSNSPLTQRDRLASSIASTAAGRTALQRAISNAGGDISRVPISTLRAMDNNRSLK